MHVDQSAQKQVDIGQADIDINDPQALASHIRFLVKHEHTFSRYQELLKSLVHRQSGSNGQEWKSYEEFLSLLRLYRAALDVGSVHSASFKRKVEEFDVRTVPGRI